MDLFNFVKDISGKLLLFLPTRQWMVRRSHSLMDKMQDSGSCDLGSIPGGITNIIVNN